MEEPMKSPQFPQTDSIKGLAEFWDTHDITDFEEQMEEVGDAFRPIFKVYLAPREAAELERMALANGMGCEELLRKWVLEKIGGR